MPQMSPLLWLMLYFMFSLIFIFFIVNVYFNFKYPIFMEDKKTDTKLINWKW